MDLTTEIEQLTKLRDKLANARPQTPLVHQATGRATILIGLLQRVLDEARVAAAAVADVAGQLKAARKN